LFKGRFVHDSWLQTTATCRSHGAQHRTYVIKSEEIVARKLVSPYIKYKPWFDLLRVLFAFETATSSY